MQWANYTPSSCSGVSTTSGSLSLSLSWLRELLLSAVDLSPSGSPSDGSAVEERERIERIERVEAVEIVLLSFLNGRARAVAPFCTVFFKDLALLDTLEDLVEEVSGDFAMMEKGARVAYLWG